VTNQVSAAEAVLNAVTLKRWDVPYQACGQSLEQIQEDVAAALRAAATHLRNDEFETCGGHSYALMIEVEDLIALADEIEAL